MSVTAALVKELREKSGAGMMDCKKALGETDGDMDAAIDWLRTKGLATAAKKSGRVAAEGLVFPAPKAPLSNSMRKLTLWRVTLNFRNLHPHWLASRLRSPILTR
jgi:hypothetical protein